MSTQNIGFYEDLTKIIFELHVSSNIIKYAYTIPNSHVGSTLFQEAVVRHSSILAPNRVYPVSQVTKTTVPWLRTTVLIEPWAGTVRG